MHWRSCRNRVYEPDPGHSKRSLRAQLNNFPEGQFVAEYDGKIVGHCATFIISEKVALRAAHLGRDHGAGDCGAP